MIRISYNVAPSAKSSESPNLHATELFPLSVFSWVLSRRTQGEVSRKATTGLALWLMWWLCPGVTQLVPSTSAAVMVSMLLADVCAGQMVLDPQPRSLRNTTKASLTLGCSRTRASLSHARVKQHFQPGGNCLGSHFSISVHTAGCWRCFPSWHLTRTRPRVLWVAKALGAALQGCSWWRKSASRAFKDQTRIINNCYKGLNWGLQVPVTQ